jgi:hypothetical protein
MIDPAQDGGAPRALRRGLRELPHAIRKRRAIAMRPEKRQRLIFWAFSPAAMRTALALTSNCMNGWLEKAANRQRKARRDLEKR